MKYCKHCLQPDTRPDIYFNENQICGACLYEEQKKQIRWDDRKKELDNIIKESKNDTKAYDCVIGVSGGKDSTFQAVYAKEKLGLRCLLVNCVPDEITEIGRKNIDNLASMGFDIIQVKPNPRIAKILAKRSFYEYGNIVKASEYCLYVSAFRIAVQFSIPLVIQGENAALTLGVSKKMESNGDAFGIFNTNTLAGGSIDLWIDENITEKDLFFYKPPTREDMAINNIKSIYLQYYAEEWSQVHNADFAIARGLIGRGVENLHDIGRYRRYSALDSDMAIPNQMIKYFKFGFGFATDEACYDIREGRISRNDAIWLVNEYDGKCSDAYIEKACTYLEINKEEFWRVVDRFVNQRLFTRDTSTAKWIPKFKVGTDLNN